MRGAIGKSRLEMNERGRSNSLGVLLLVEELEIRMFPNWRNAIRILAKTSKVGKQSEIRQQSWRVSLWSLRLIRTTGRLQDGFSNQKTQWNHQAHAHDTKLISLFF